jgi:anti-sigma factor RsiW
MNPFDRAQGVGQECPREQDVVNAVLSGVWNTIEDEELSAHSAQCETCREIAAISALLREDNEQARREAQVPAAGQVWWRAAVRARLERTQAATQPMTLMHGVTAAIAIGILLAVVGMAWPSIAGAIGGIKTLAAEIPPNGEIAVAVVGALRQSLTLALVVTAGLIITPVAIYFALSD